MMQVDERKEDNTCKSDLDLCSFSGILRMLCKVDKFKNNFRFLHHLNHSKMLPAGSDSGSVSSFISPSVAAKQRFQPSGSTVLAALEKPSPDVHIDFDEFYAERVANFESERSVFNHYFRLIEPKRDDTYNLEWENRKLIEETRISQVEHAQLDEKIQAIQHDIEVMKQDIAQEHNSKIVRRQQIQRLEELARPVERDITYIVPDRFSHNRNLPFENNKVTFRDDGSSSRTGSGSGRAATKSATVDMLKTVKTGEVIQLEARLQDETLRVTAYTQDIHTLVRNAVENRHLRAVHYAETHKGEIERAKELWQVHDAADFQCFYAVAELLKLRFRIMIAQREEIEALETLQRERDDFKVREEELKSEILDEMNRSKKVMQQEVEESTRDFQRQLASLQERIEDQYRQRYELEAREAQMSMTEEKLHAHLQLLRDRYEKLRRHHSLDMEGYRSEIAMLEKKLQILAKNVKKRDEEDAFLAHKAQLREQSIQKVAKEVAQLHLLDEDLEQLLMKQQEEAVEKSRSRQIRGREVGIVGNKAARPVAKVQIRGKSTPSAHPTTPNASHQKPRGKKSSKQPKKLNVTPSEQDATCQKVAKTLSRMKFRNLQQQEPMRSRPIAESSIGTGGVHAIPLSTTTKNKSNKQALQTSSTSPRQSAQPSSQRSPQP